MKSIKSLLAFTAAMGMIVGALSHSKRFKTTKDVTLSEDLKAKAQAKRDRKRAKAKGEAFARGELTSTAFDKTA